MALKITKEPMENRQLAVTIEVEQERVDREMKKAARKVGSKYRIPGFRQGKAPYNIILQFIGPEVLYQEFVEDLGQEMFKAAIEQEGLEPYATAALNDVQYDPLRYLLTVPLEPEVDLGDYRSLRIAETVAEVSDEGLEEALDKYREQYAGWQETDEAADYGDLMTIAVKSVLTDATEDEDSVVMNEAEWDVTPDQENPMDPPGFDEELVGMKAGENKEFTLSWPEDSQSVYAGRSTVFNVTVHKVQTHQNAELTDELAQMIGPDFETVEDLRNGVRESLLETAKQEAEAEFLDKAMAALLAQSHLNYPPAVIDDQLDVMMNEMDQQIRQMGLGGLDDYLKMIKQDKDEYREQNREQATKIAERNLIVSEIINQEKLEISESELMERIKEMFGDEDPESESAQNMIAMFRDGAGRPIIESQLLTKKALDRLLAIVRGEEIPEPAASSQADDADEAPSSDASKVDIAADGPDNAFADETVPGAVTVEAIAIEEATGDDAEAGN